VCKLHADRIDPDFLVAMKSEWGLEDRACRPKLAR